MRFKQNLLPTSTQKICKLKVEKLGLMDSCLNNCKYYFRICGFTLSSVGYNITLKINCVTFSQFVLVVGNLTHDSDKEWIRKVRDAFLYSTTFSNDISAPICSLSVV